MQEGDKDNAWIKIRGVDDKKIFSLSALHSQLHSSPPLAPPRPFSLSSAVGCFCRHRWNSNDVVMVEFPTPYTNLHVNMQRCFLCMFKCIAVKPRYRLSSHPLYMHICPLFLSQAFRQNILAALCLLFMSHWSSQQICGCCASLE